MGSSILVAVYGTLRRGEPGWRQFRMDRRAACLGPCLIPGRLYDLGRYPGLVEGDGAVVGELHRLRAPYLLAALDRFEGARPDAPETGLFIRRMRLIDPSVDAIVYLYNDRREPRAMAHARPIEGGDWLLRPRFA